MLTKQKAPSNGPTTAVSSGPTRGDMRRRTGATQPARRPSLERSESNSSTLSSHSSCRKKGLACNKCAKNVVKAHAEAVKAVPDGCTDTSQYAKAFLKAFGLSAAEIARRTAVGTVNACAFCGLATAGVLVAPDYIIGAAGAAVGLLCGTALSILTPITGYPAFLGFEVADFFGTISAALAHFIPTALIGAPLLGGGSLKVLEATGAIDWRTSDSIKPLLMPGWYVIMWNMGP